MHLLFLFVLPIFTPFIKLYKKFCWTYNWTEHAHKPLLVNTTFSQKGYLSLMVNIVEIFSYSWLWRLALYIVNATIKYLLVQTLSFDCRKSAKLLKQSTNHGCFCTQSPVAHAQFTLPKVVKDPFLLDRSGEMIQWKMLLVRLVTPYFTVPWVMEWRC